MARPKASYQGKIIIETDDDGFLIMFPTGDIVGASTRQKAEAKARAWFKQHAAGNAINVGEIEWR